MLLDVRRVAILMESWEGKMEDGKQGTLGDAVDIFFPDLRDVFNL